MTETTPNLTPAVEASLQRLTAGRHEVEAWTQNLERALADDVAADRLTQEQAAAIAKDAGVKPPPAPTAEAKPEAAPKEEPKARPKADDEKPTSHRR